MRLKNHELPGSEAVSILENNTYGVLALEGDGGYAYAVPVNYAYVGNKIYFHGAKEGHKIDAMNRNNKVSFCVVEKDTVIPERFDTQYRSAIAFGRIRMLEDDKERYAALEALIRKFSPDHMERGKESIKKEWGVVASFEIDVEFVTAKVGAVTQ